MQCRITKGFTLVELLVTVSIIGILMAMVFGALHAAQNSAREAATKATIAKLNGIVMERMNSYLTRRVPIRLEFCPSKHADGTPYTHDEQVEWFRMNAKTRLAAIRDLQRMEMPERFADVVDAPATLPNNVTVPDPQLHRLYASKYAAKKPSDDNNHAECLYILVSLGSPEAMEQFRQNEIGDTDNDGWPEFIDGWGKPIYWLRWAPGCAKSNSNGYSGIQSGDVVNDHDPFDTIKVDSSGFHLIPLIWSYGRSGAKNVDVGKDVHFSSSTSAMIAPDTICGPGYYVNNGAATDDSAKGNITNHSVESR